MEESNNIAQTATDAYTMLAAGGFKVLVACEESQTVCKAFRAFGIEAYSCDLQEPSGNKPEWHIQGDAVKEAYSGKYDMMIAHPPCTYMSKASARWMYPTAGNLSQERFELAMEAKDMFMKLINAPIKHIAVENPVPLKVVGLPKHSQAVQPYEYGHKYSKKTLLWLKNLPLLKPTDIVENYKPYLPSNTGGKKRGQKYQFKNITQKDSSKTFEGIARAMAEQWLLACC
jgi:site-specific DNA-cytosine methylase